MNLNDNIKILIIDDSPESVAVLDNALPRQYKRQAALSGAEGLMLLHDSEVLPDLIILDVMMPVMNGYEVCKHIKSNIRYKYIPIIFISALNETFDKVKAFELGGVDFITKPFHDEEIKARVETHLEIAHSRKEIHELYSKTLQGTIIAMNDILSIANPEVSKFSNAMRSFAEKIEKRLLLNNMWDLKLACQLSSIGLLTESELKSVESGQNSIICLDKEKTNEHIILSTKVIENVPRLESIILILTSSLLPLNEAYNYKSIDTIPEDVLKGHILRLLFHFFYMMSFNYNHISVLKHMRNDSEEYYLVEVLDVVKEIQDKISGSDIMPLELFLLKPGMVLAEDIVTKENRTLLKAGYEFTDSIISILKSYHEFKDTKIKMISNEVISFERNKAEKRNSIENG